MGFSPKELAIFAIENLGPALEKNAFGDIKILIIDDQRVSLPIYAEVVGYLIQCIHYFLFEKSFNFLISKDNETFIFV